MAKLSPAFTLEQLARVGQRTSGYNLGHREAIALLYHWQLDRAVLSQNLRIKPEFNWETMKGGKNLRDLRPTIHLS